MKAMTNPNEGISVILPVYNGSKYLRESIDSIINQNFKNFELIIIDDGSIDNSWEIVSSYSYLSNIKAIKQENIGLAATLNKGILHSQFNFIARQDQDDISTPDRLEKQFNFLKSHPEIDLVGSWANIIEENTFSKRMLTHPTNDKEIKMFLLFDTPFVHSSVIFKKDLFLKCGLYSTDLNSQPPEDYELWTRMALICNFANLPTPLLQYREIKTSMSRTVGDQFIKNVIKASNKYISELDVNIELVPINEIFHDQIRLSDNINFHEVFSVYKKLWMIIFKHPFNPFEKIARFHLNILFKKILKHKIQKLKSH